MTTHINTPAVNVSSYKIYISVACRMDMLQNKSWEKNIDQSIKSDIGMINSDESSTGVGK